MCIEIVGYLLEELRDVKNYELFQKDIADANIFIGSLIFIEELAEKVSPIFFTAPAQIQLIHITSSPPPDKDMLLFQTCSECLADCCDCGAEEG